MSTRATYEFTPGPFTPGVTFYVHYDGYPEGAARYFYAMLNHPNDRGGLAAKFIRANELAEFTDAHDAHGDTEYRYTVNVGESNSNDAGALMTMFERTGWNPTTWKLGYSGTIAAFLDKYSNMIENYKPFKRVKTEFGSVWLNEPLAQVMADDKVSTLTTWAKGARGRGVSPVNEGNWRSAVRAVARLIVAFPGMAAVGSLESVVVSEVSAEVEKLRAAQPETAGA